MDLFAREFLLPRSIARHLHLTNGMTASQIAERLRAPFDVIASQLLDALLLPRVEPSAADGAGEKPLNAEQARAAAHRGTPYLLGASPGTGKTQTLVARVSARLSLDSAKAASRGRRRAHALTRRGGGILDARLCGQHTRPRPPENRNSTKLGGQPAGRGWIGRVTGSGNARQKWLEPGGSIVVTRTAAMLRKPGVRGDRRELPNPVVRGHSRFARPVMPML
jgi:UvrD-like helicase family protein